MPALFLTVAAEIWPLAEAFTISRGSKTSAAVVVVTVTDRATGISGRGEAVPYPRYGETVDGVISAIRAAASAIEVCLTDQFCDRQFGQNFGLTGAALNAVDCALWDLRAKQTGVRAHASAGVTKIAPVLTAYTLSLASPDAMAAKALAVAHLPLLKLKLGSEHGGATDDARMRAVRAARPDARLIADANEGWTDATLEPLMRCAAELGFETIEQPLAADRDDALSRVQHLVPVTADESIHTAADIPRLIGRYDAVNIKLDKAGGLSGALALRDGAKAAGMKIMVGSMVATSLAVAPAMIVAQGADWVDVDGPLLLARDRADGLVIENGWVSPPEVRLWG